MISNGEKREAKSEGRQRQWHYLAVKEFSAILREITYKNNDDFYYLIFFHSFRTKNKPESYKRIYIPKSEDIPSGFSNSTIPSFRSIENKHDVYRGKDCMKKFRKFLIEHALKVINFNKRKVKLLTKALIFGRKY